MEKQINPNKIENQMYHHIMMDQIDRIKEINKRGTPVPRQIVKAFISVITAPNHLKDPIKENIMKESIQ